MSPLQQSVVPVLSSREAVIVAVDANRSKGSVEAVEWALRHVVRPRDIFVVLGVFRDHQLAKKNSSCFPVSKFLINLGVSGISEKLEFIGQGKLDPIELEEKFRSSLEPLYNQCRRNEVRFELKLAEGSCPARLTIDEAQNFNTRWIVLDSHFRKSKIFVRGHVSCNIAVVKGKDFASLMMSKATQPEISLNPEEDNVGPTSHFCVETDNNSALAKLSKEESSDRFSAYQLRKKCAPPPHPHSPCCYPLSWRSGFPRAFSYDELKVITNGFSDDNISEQGEEDTKVYQGILQDTSVLIKSFEEANEGFWSMLRILSRVCHRNIMNLVGYCSTGASAFLLFDYPCLGNVEMNLKCDDLARNLGWRARWSIALEIGGSLRYLHEECVDGPIVHKSIRSSSVCLSHGYSATLCHFKTVEWLTGDFPPNEDLIAKCRNLEEDERLLVGDVHDYGKLLLELITGKSACCFKDQGKDHSMIDWALPLLENGVVSELMDCRLVETASDSRMVRHMAHAALCCLKMDSDHKLSISEALAIVRGDRSTFSIQR